ncbi:hypothetical protein Ahy_A08g038562 [Arachis hypogaea]|uniref:Squalene epoxidase domain-containing protein n=1 Tax=Arachis hypogaea TaxID=3818 RepID=A0A445BU10_ARAHY|nr:hypothetical protein Ahy_A08g038562 [Arachis hypogaea]
MVGDDRGLNFVENVVRNYISREIRNVFEVDDAKELKKYILREQNQNFFELELEYGHEIISSIYLNVSFVVSVKKFQKVPQKLNNYKRHVEIQQEMNYIYDVDGNKWLIGNIFVLHDYIFVLKHNRLKIVIYKFQYILIHHLLSIKTYKVLEQVVNSVSSHDKSLLKARRKKFDELVFYSHNFCEFASECLELTAILHRAFDNIMNINSKIMKEICYHNSHEDGYLDDVNEFQNPPHGKIRGRLKKWLGSNTEKNITNARKRKKKALLETLQRSKRFRILFSDLNTNGSPNSNFLLTPFFFFFPFSIGVPSSSLMLPSSTAPSSPRVALLNRAPADASSLMSPSTMIQQPRPLLVRPLKLATVCCPTASLLLTTGLVASLLSATDAHQHDNFLSAVLFQFKTNAFGMILKKSQGLWVLLVSNRVHFKTKSGEELIAKAPLTVVCDSYFSNLRRSLCNPKVVDVTDVTELKTDKTKLSHIVELDLVYHSLSSNMLGVVANLQEKLHHDDSIKLFKANLRKLVRSSLLVIFLQHFWMLEIVSVILLTLPCSSIL